MSFNIFHVLVPILIVTCFAFTVRMLIRMERRQGNIEADTERLISMLSVSVDEEGKAVTLIIQPLNKRSTDIYKKKTNKAAIKNAPL